jgi:hypothetical protein
MALGILDGSQIICPYCSMEEGLLAPIEPTPCPGLCICSANSCKAWVARWLGALAKRNGHLVRIVRIG